MHHHARSIDADDLRRALPPARGGTLLLDEVQHLSREAQEALFSLLEEAPRCDVRVLVGTSLSLVDEVSAGRFDESLFYRLNVNHLDHLRGQNGDRMKVSELMSTPAHTCQLDSDLGAVTHLMWQHDCGFVPVIDPSGQVIGVVTDRDICVATATRRLLPERMSAAQVMTAPVHTCLADDEVRAALAVMKAFRVRRLPVIDAHGHLQGVLSLNDIVLAADAKRRPSALEIIATMAAICAHRPLGASAG